MAGSPSFRVKDVGDGRGAIDCARAHASLSRAGAIDCARAHASLSRAGAINCAPTITYKDGGPNGRGECGLVTH